MGCVCECYFMCVEKVCISVFQFVFERKYKLLKYLFNNFCWLSSYFSLIMSHGNHTLSVSNNINNNSRKHKISKPTKK
jgi:hypothetical protein